MDSLIPSPVGILDWNLLWKSGEKGHENKEATDPCIQSLQGFGYCRKLVSYKLTALLFDQYLGPAACVKVPQEGSGERNMSLD